jgi:hypothetical protein
MKRLLLSLAVLVSTLASYAQSNDILDFVCDTPWTLTPREIELNYEGVETYPLLEALYPLSGDIIGEFSSYFEGSTTLEGFRYAGLDAYVMVNSWGENNNFDTFIAFLSPERTADAPSEDVLTLLCMEIVARCGDPIHEEVQEIKISDKTSIYTMACWRSGADSIVTVFFMVNPELSENPLLYGYVGSYDPGKEYIEEVEYIVAEEAAEEAVAEEAVAEEPAEAESISEVALEAPQSLIYLIHNTPWGCSKEVFDEMFGDHVVTIDEAFATEPTLLANLKQNFGSTYFISGHNLGNYDIFLEYPFDQEDVEKGTPLQSFTAVLVPDGKPINEVVAEATATLTAALGSPFMEGQEPFEEGDLLQTVSNMWVTESSVIYISTLSYKNDIENPFCAFISLMDLNALGNQEEQEQAEEESIESDLWEQVSAFENEDDAHMHFRGISFNKDIYTFCAELEKLGYTKQSEEKQTYTRIYLSGYYGDKECILCVCSTPTSEKVFLVRVMFPTTTSWSNLRSTYNTFQRRLTNKFGEPEVVEQFQDVYEEGSGLEMAGIESGHVTLLSEYNNTEKMGLGLIQLSVAAENYEGYVFISFFDSLNLVLREQEVEDLL